jgi:hypothetical protein
MTAHTQCSRGTRLLALVASLAIAMTALVAPGSAHADERPTMRSAGLAISQSGEPEVRDLDAACPAGRVPGSDFTDIGPPFGRAIECLVWYEVTRGRTATTYDTGARVTRGQMALFLHRLLSYNLRVDALPGERNAHAFTDVPTSGELGRALNALSSDELAEALDLDAPLVRGFGDGTYRAGTGVERAQMASFIARTFDGLLVAYDGRVVQSGFCTFTDSSAIPEAHRTNVSDVCAAGIAQGRADGSFAPRDTVTRGQMAAFLMRTQDIFADEPFYALLPDQDLEIVDRDACDAQNANGSDAAPWCTIQEGVDAASTARTRVLVAGSEDPYVEEVDLGPGGIELVGAPVADGDDQLLLPVVEGYVDSDGDGEDLLIGRLGVFAPEGEAGMIIENAGDLRITGLYINSDVFGLFAEARNVRIDGTRIQGAAVGLWLDAESGDVRGSEILGAQEAHLVDEAGSLDLGEILTRTGAGLSNLFSPAGEVGTFDGHDAIVPAS